MTTKAVYLMAGPMADAAVLRGLRSAECNVIQTQSIAQTIGAVTAADSETVVLVADVQADAIPCLILLREYIGKLPATLLIDQEGTNINYPIKAMQLGVSEYMLVSDPEIQRELGARLLVERSHARPAQPEAALHCDTAVVSRVDLPFKWDPVAYVIAHNEQYIRLSPAEGRLFGLLIANRGQTVAVRDLMRHALRKPDVELKLGLRQLRPHMMRLRRKLCAVPNLTLRIVSTRGMGYMLV